MGPAVLAESTPLVGLLPLAEPALLFIFLLAVGITAISSIGFALWLACQVIRLVVMLLARLVMLPGSCARRARKTIAPAASAAAHLACPDPVCRAVSPEHARYCRQCGRMLRAPLQIAA